jgi:hypothetical protein
MYNFKFKDTFNNAAAKLAAMADANPMYAQAARGVAGYGAGVVAQTVANQFLSDDREANPFIAGLGGIPVGLAGGASGTMRNAYLSAAAGSALGNVAGTAIGGGASNVGVLGGGILGGLAPYTMFLMGGDRDGASGAKVNKPLIDYDEWVDSPLTTPPKGRGKQNLLM